MTDKDLEYMYYETAVVFGTLNMICKRLYAEEKLLYMGLMETYSFVADEDD
ncbi:hypothetical protein LCGC14_1062230 [marine sediment metagenome]|uniref:Uncharacterized protein n=1 Tax=marine sediment metagenome TaxID=412755 RepID=A0A0F9QRP5_9ZZZZ